MGDPIDRGRLASFSAEPTGTTYRQLVAFAAECSPRFSLVWRRGLCETPAADEVATSLAPYLEEETLTNRWPGTVLVNESAVVRTYRFCEESERLLAAAEGLFAWRGPDRPEDLAFYGRSGECWLGSICGEREAFVWLDRVDLTVLRERVPDLELAPAR